jgi:hypothetical protein
MTPTLVIAILVGLLFLAIAGYGIWQWGPGLRKRSVWCPVLKRRAKVLADQREAEFARLVVADIKSCSLLNGTLTCKKECIPHL